MRLSSETGFEDDALFASVDVSWLRCWHDDEFWSIGETCVLISSNDWMSSTDHFINDCRRRRRSKNAQILIDQKRTGRTELTINYDREMAAEFYWSKCQKKSDSIVLRWIFSNTHIQCTVPDLTQRADAAFTGRIPRHCIGAGTIVRRHIVPYLITRADTMSQKTHQSGITQTSILTWAGAVECMLNCATLTVPKCSTLTITHSSGGRRWTATIGTVCWTGETDGGITFKIVEAWSRISFLLGWKTKNRLRSSWKTIELPLVDIQTCWYCPNSDTDHTRTRSHCS